ncbi:MAG: hypothetical protein V2A78_05910, partial [bacterium]
MSVFAGFRPRFPWINASDCSCFTPFFRRFTWRSLRLSNLAASPTVKYPSSAFEITSYLRISLLDMVTILSLMVTFSQNSYRVTISQNNN